jgi:hypothetical protein
MSDFEKLKNLLESNKTTIKKLEQIIKNKDLNIKNLKNKLEQFEKKPKKKTVILKKKMPFKTQDERDELSKMRDKKLKELRKGKGAGRPVKPRTTLSREQLTAMRDEKLSEIRSGY